MSSSSCSCCGLKVSNAKILWCAKCKIQPYCSKECQVQHWKEHKKKCKTPAEAAAEKEKAEHLLRELRLAVEGPAARGSVKPPTLLVEVDDLRLTPEATAERMQNLEKVAATFKDEEGWAAMYQQDDTVYDSLFKELVGLFSAQQFAEICARKAAIVKASLSCYKRTNLPLLCVATEIWYMLAESQRKTMQYQDALKFFLRAYDAATHYKVFEPEKNKNRSLKIVVSSSMKIIMIMLEQANLVSDTKRYTKQYVIPLLIQLDTSLKELSRDTYLSMLPKTWYLSADACLKVNEFSQAAKYLQNMTEALQNLSHVDQKKALDGQVYCKFKTAQVHMQSRNFKDAMVLCGEVHHDGHKRGLHYLSVLGLFLAVEIDIAVVFHAQECYHDAYDRAQEKSKSLKRYIEAHKQELHYEYPFLRRQLDQLYIMILLRQARCMHKMLKAPQTEIETQELVLRETAYHTAAMKTIMKLEFAPAPQSAEQYSDKSNLWLACHLVLIARMRKKVSLREGVAQDKKSDWEPRLKQAETVLRQVSANTRCTENESSYATLFLALLYDFWEKNKAARDDDDALSLILEYLNFIATSTQYQTEARKITCFGCGKEMQSTQRCARCRTVNYCSAECQKYDNLSFWKGGLWFKPPHYAMCAVLGAFREWQQKLQKKQSAQAGESMNMDAFAQSLSSSERQVELAQDPEIKESLEKLHTLIQEFIANQ